MGLNNLARYYSGRMFLFNYDWDIFIL